ncbi:interleukin-2 receptor subunit beta isoform X2 [Triplophysa rosa]|uniref:interleukin-2 receptor subunit beta isoform X2 n=1 Tax=Triplophysa rosa TaxID=992332 RepID=UPI002545FCC5|nr:interleukin-2 receptor subunit beta isoform X2 [Triplophysa rosa]XP_057193613.1 interleukin-2 receptor subunit beta isoform X2 [Triplophysa rosa]XP_057193614.1 interleukin-2 receptor subunit beta isoform X2 [Triplophysa rosa]
MARMLILMMMMILHLSLTDQSLLCHHDYFNTFTCMWNISKLDLRPPITAATNCTLHVYVKKALKTYFKSQRMTMKSSEVNILTASVEFNKRDGIIIGAANISQNVTCENHKNLVAQTQQHKAKESVVKVFPPVELKVDGFNVSWRRGTPLKSSLKGQDFELQFRSDEQSWTDVESTHVTELRVELQEDSLVLDQRYVLRVRAKLSGQTTAIWSDWSTEYKWTSKVGKPHPPPVAGDSLELNWSSLVIWITLTGMALALMLILSLLFKYNRRKWLQKMRSSYIPDPSKYFTDLNSHHTGNFKSWLGSAFALDHFIAVDSELVSPVEVVKLQDALDSRLVDRHGDASRDGWENTSKTSNFSNSTYFLSQSSKGPVDALEPCSAHCSYGPAGGIGGPGEGLQNSADVARGAGESNETSELEKRLEQLRQDTQSPDSGFAAGAEDSMEETELPSPRPLLNLPAPHPDKHLPLSWEQTPLVPGPIRLIPHIDLDLKLFSSCGMIEPSSGDYMPVENVQN